MTFKNNKKFVCLIEEKILSEIDEMLKPDLMSVKTKTPLLVHLSSYLILTASRQMTAYLRVDENRKRPVDCRM